MNVKNCKDCGKYKYIKSDGLCSFTNKLYIDDMTVPKEMENRKYS